LRRPRGAQHGTGAGEPRHHRADGNAGGFGDLTIGQVVDLPQYEGFPERFGERLDHPADACSVAAAQHFCFRACLGFVPERNPSGGLGRILDRRGRRAGAPGIFGATDIAQDRKQPRLDLRAAIGVEMPECAQIALLHCVLGVGHVAQEIPRERIDVVEMRQRRLTKAPRSLRIVAR
jgi:hypothetical protein